MLRGEILFKSLSKRSELKAQEAADIRAAEHPRILWINTVSCMKKQDTMLKNQGSNEI